MDKVGFVIVDQVAAWIIAVILISIMYVTLDLTMGFPLSWPLVLLGAWILQIVAFVDLRNQDGS